MANHSKTARGLVPILRRWLSSPWIAVVAVALGLLLTCRSVSNGLIADDFYHRSVLSGSQRFAEQLRGPQAMMRFLTGDPADNQAWMDVGFLPWWTDPQIKAEFLQLIPTQTHILDYWLWPDRPALMHVHSLAWFALLVLLAAMFYRRILGPTWMAGIAALLFAIEDGHASPVGWIANRNILIAASFGIGCLIAHDVWRRDGKRWACALALLLWTACLCSKEAGIATCAYLFAYAVWLDDAKLWERFLTLVPYGVVLIVWRAVRDSLGFGAEHVGYYVDPITEPARFASALLERYPVLMFGQWAGLSDLWLVLDVESIKAFVDRPTFWWTAVGYVCLLTVLMWPLLRRDGTARFFATGMLLAVIPICAAMPMDRLLMFAGLGAFGLLALFWQAVFVSDSPRRNSSSWRLMLVPVALLLVLLHVIAAPVLLTLRSSAPMGPPEFVRQISLNVAFDETIARQDLVIVNAPVPGFISYSFMAYDYQHRPAPRAWRTLAPGLTPVTVRRTDERTLEIESAGYLMLFDQLFRNQANPLRLGDQVRVARMTATVLEVEDSERLGLRPRKVAFRFEESLEGSSLRWLRFSEGEFVPWTPPAVGEQIVLDAKWRPSW